MPFLQKPSAKVLDALLQECRQQPLSYHHAGGVDRPPSRRFLNDHYRIRLGHGQAVFEKAAEAITQWQMVPLWTQVHPAGGSQQPGQMFVTLMHLCGMWWVNPGRILEQYDSATQRGFVFGTLPGHAESGEERFLVEMLPDGSVWYEIRSFSRPRHPLTWLGFPLARWWQLKFVRDSQAAMQALTRHG